MLAAAPRGPLRGVPVVIKDEWPLPWRAQRFGAAEMLGRRPSPGESGPYRALRDAGAVIVGVANMHELGAGSTGNVSVYGPARNPWDTERCPGGSSSGPAAAVAARLVAGAVGADGIGSIRYPAAYCGLTGLKPTFGRSAMEGHHMHAATTTIVSGPLCADAADCRLLGSALFGEELRGGRGRRAADRRRPRPRLREDCAPEVREACEAAIEALRGRDRRRGRARSRSTGLEPGPAGRDPDRQHRGASAELTPQRLNELERGARARSTAALLKYRMLLPAAAIARRASASGRCARASLAALFEDVDVLAWPTVAGGRAAARRPAGRASLGHRSAPTRPTSAAAASPT